MRAAISKWFGEMLWPTLAALAALAAFLVGVALNVAYYRASGRTQAYLSATAAVGFVVALSWVFRLLRRERGRGDRALAELGDAQDRLRQRLPEEARELLDSRPRTFYFLDHDAVSGLYAQIRGKLQVVEVREIRKRDARVRAKLGGGAAGIGADLGSAAEQESRSAAVAALAPEFNEALEHMILNDQIRFGLDRPRSFDPQAIDAFVRKDQSEFPRLKEALHEAIASHADAVRGVTKQAYPDELERGAWALLSGLMAGYRFGWLSDLLKQVAGNGEYVYISGEFRRHNVDDYVELSCVHPAASALPEAVAPTFLIRVRRSAPGLTPTGVDAFAPGSATQVVLKCLGKAFAWDGETHTLRLSPIAIF
jgi:hypothetical protein